MPPTRFKIQRIKRLEDQLDILYEKRHTFEQEMLISASANQKFELQQRLKREVLPSLRRLEGEYAELLIEVAEPDELPTAEAQAMLEEVREGVTAHEHAKSADKSEELRRLLSDIRDKLDEPEKAAAAKLKVVLPLIPLIASYELELDTESFLTQVWGQARKLFEQVIPNHPQ